MFLYEEYSQSDFIKDFCENHTFLDHLFYMFPNDYIAPWDIEATYKIETIEIYVEAGCVKPINKPFKEIKRRWIKIKQTTTLKKVLEHPDIVIPKFPIFYIISNESKFKEEFLKKEF